MVLYFGSRSIFCITRTANIVECFFFTLDSLNNDLKLSDTNTWTKNVSSRFLDANVVEGTQNLQFLLDTCDAAISLTYLNQNCFKKLLDTIMLSRDSELVVSPRCMRCSYTFLLLEGIDQAFTWLSDDFSYVKIQTPTKMTIITLTAKYLISKCFQGMEILFIHRFTFL